MHTHRLVLKENGQNSGVPQVSVQLYAAASLIIFAFDCAKMDIDYLYFFHHDLTLNCQKSQLSLTMIDLTSFVFLSNHHDVCFFSLFFLVNLQYSNHVRELLKGLSCGLLYTGRKHTEQMSVYTFRPKATLVHRENHETLFFCPWGESIFGCLASTLFVPVLQTPSINFLLRLSEKALIYWPHSVFGH